MDIRNYLMNELGMGRDMKDILDEIAEIANNLHFNDWETDEDFGIDEAVDALLTAIANTNRGKFNNDDMKVLEKSLTTSVNCAVDLLLAQKSGDDRAWKDITSKYLNVAQDVDIKGACTGDCGACGGCHDEEEVKAEEEEKKPEPESKTKVSVKVFDGKGKEMTMDDARKAIEDFFKNW